MTERKRSKARQKEDRKSSWKTPAIVVAAIVIIAALAYLSYSELYGTTSFQDFKSAFNSAPNVAIYINDTNSTTYQYILGCTSSLIQELTGPTAAHRNSTTIRLFVIYNNSQSCLYSTGKFGYSVNYSYDTVSNCLNYSRTAPSIFFSYGDVNHTSIIGNRLYIAGDKAFMNYCGIAYQIV